MGWAWWTELISLAPGGEERAIDKRPPCIFHTHLQGHKHKMLLLGDKVEILCLLTPALWWHAYHPESCSALDTKVISGINTLNHWWGWFPTWHNYTFLQTRFRNRKQIPFSLVGTIQTTLVIRFGGKHFTYWAVSLVTISHSHPNGLHFYLSLLSSLANWNQIPRVLVNEGNSVCTERWLGWRMVVLSWKVISPKTLLSFFIFNMTEVTFLSCFGKALKNNGYLAS